MLNIREIKKINVNKIISEYTEISPEAGEDDSFRSWDYCRSVFCRATCKRYGMQDGLTDVENCRCKHCCNACNVGKGLLCYNCLALNLGFYLASWGMYRGSSFLCCYNHTIHIGAVKILMDKKYVPLFDPYLWQNNRAEYTKLTSEVFCRLWDYYEYYANKFYTSKGNAMHVSDTLITKILMGVYGCMPAYDTYVKAGLAKYGATKNVTPKNIKTVLDELVQIADALDTQIKAVLAKATWDKCGLYTPMKIIDMIFWKIR